MLVKGEREHGLLLLVVPREIEDRASEARHSCDNLGVERAEEYSLERRHV
jgi:hypothetical protein